MIQVRQSTIESFRRVRDGAYGANEAELVAYIHAGENSEPNRKMAFGTSWHAVLQDGKRHWCGDNWFKVGDFRFHKDAVAFAGHTIGPGLVEQAGSIRLRVAGEDVLLTGTCDHLHGRVIQDHKSKLDEGTPQLDPEPYFDSFQWRAYLLMHDASCFRYNLWGFKDKGAGEVDLVDFLSCRMWAYPRMRADVLETVESFVEWARPNSLLKYLKPKEPNRAR